MFLITKEMLAKCSRKAFIKKNKKKMTFVIIGRVKKFQNVILFKVVFTLFKGQKIFFSKVTKILFNTRKRI